MENKKAAVYIRVAHADDMAMETQTDMVMRFAKTEGYSVSDCYSDNGENELTLNRPEMNRLLSDVRGGEIKTVIAKDIVRIARDFLLTTKFLDEMRKYGVAVITVHDGEVRPFIENHIYNLLLNQKRIKV